MWISRWEAEVLASLGFPVDDRFQPLSQSLTRLIVCARKVAWAVGSTYGLPSADRSQVKGWAVRLALRLELRMVAMAGEEPKESGSDQTPPLPQNDASSAGGSLSPSGRKTQRRRSAARNFKDW